MQSSAVAISINTTLHTNRCYVLMGLPGSGKSYWRDKIMSSWRGKIYPAVISEDILIEEECAEKGVLYDHVHEHGDFVARANELMRQFNGAMGVNRDIILDGHHLTEVHRGQFLELLPDTYQRIGVVFTVPDNVLFSRLAQCASEGKTISSATLRDMRKRYQNPGRYEFHRITHIDHTCQFG